MNYTQAFLSGFSPLPEGTALPREICADYEPVSSLSRREERLVLLVRRRRDSALFVLKRGPWEEIETERQLLARLAPIVPGAVPEPADCFREDGDGYLLRSYLEGETLAQYRERSDGCSPERCGEIGRELCGLMEILHSQDPPVIHRDIKPENIILLEGGGLGLIDFGAARRYTPGQDTDTRYLGTCTTAAPEQYGYAQTDPRTDLYAAGATLLWLAAGTYDRGAMSGLPQWLKRALEKAMAFDPADRWTSAGAMRDALARKFPWKKAALGALAAVCALLVLCGALSGRDRTPKGTDPVEFPSEVLEAAVREELGIPEGTVTYGDLERVERLAAVGRETFSREQTFDVRVEPYVDEVWKGEMPRGDVSDLSLLAWMPNLTELYLCGQKIADVTPLAGLPLVTLALHDNDIADITPLDDLSETLERLYLGANPVEDYTALSRLRWMYYLNLDSPEGLYPESFTFLAGLDLAELALRWVQPADGNWFPLSTLKKLAVLHLWGAPEEAIAAVHDLPGLVCLTAGEWTCGDLSCVVGMPVLDSLNIYGGLDSFAGVEALTNLDIIFVDGEGELDLAPLAGLPKLRHLELYGMTFPDFSPLATLERLEELGLDPEQKAAACAVLPELTDLFIS